MLRTNPPHLIVGWALGSDLEHRVVLEQVLEGRIETEVLMDLNLPDDR